MGRGTAQVGKSTKGTGLANKGANDGAPKRPARKSTVMEVPKLIEKPIPEAKKRMLELRASMTKKYSTEGQMRQVNEKVASAQWRKELRSNKRDTLLVDSEAADYTMVRCLSRMERNINEHCEDFEEFQQALLWVTRSQDVAIRALEALGTRRLIQMREDFSTLQQAVRQQFEGEISNIRESHSHTIMQQKRKLVLLDRSIEEGGGSVLQEFHTQKGDKRNRYLEKISNLRMWMNASVDKVEKQFDQEHLKYIDSTDDRTRDFQLLRERDNVLSLDIERKIRHIVSLQRGLTFWRKKLCRSQRESANRNDSLRNQRLLLLKQYTLLKGEVQRRRERSNHHMLNMSSMSRKARMSNRRCLAQAERILTLQQQCSRKQNMRDQLAIAKATNNGGQQPSPENVPKEPIVLGNENTLANHFKSVSRVEHEIIQWRHTVEELKQKNLELKQSISCFVEGVSATENCVNGNNNLLVINGQCDISPPFKNLYDVPTVYVESTQVQRNYNLQSHSG